MSTCIRFVPLLVLALWTTPHAQERPAVGNRPQPSFPPPPISAAQSDPELIRALDGYLDRLSKEDRFSGVVLVAKDGQPIFEKAYGLADRARRVPNTVATRFNIASIGKQFTIAAIDLLKDAGTLKADDTLGALLPEHPNERAQMATVQQLIDHRGGIPDFFGPDFSAASPARFRSNADYYAFVAPRPLDFDPGSQRRYCNGCYLVLGEIIAKVSGVPYERFVQERIFAPRGMTSTGWFATDDIVENVATGYSRRLPGSEGTLRANLFAHGAAGSAAGGVYSTASDLLKFFQDGPTGKPEGAPVSIGIAGGAPGTNAMVESAGRWMVIALTNQDPPAASVAVAIVQALK